MRLVKEQIKEINKLSKDGKSIRYISKDLGLGLTTVYYHTRKIHGKQLPSFEPSVWKSIEIGEIIGAFAGDGSYYNSTFGRGYNHICRFHFNKQETDYIKSISSLLKRAGLNVFLCKYANRNCIDIKVNSIGLASFVKRYLNREGKKTYSVHLKP